MHKGVVVAKGKTVEGNQYIVVQLSRNCNYIAVVDYGGLPGINKKVKIGDEVKIVRTDDTAVWQKDEDDSYY